MPLSDISRVARSPDPSYNISSVGLRAMVQERLVRVERRLAAILAADVAGYSRLMHHHEEATHAKLTALLADTIAPAISEHGGRIVKNTGDGFLAEFPSAVQAVRAAVQFQTRITELTIAETEDRRIVFRTGINIGDAIIESHDIFGDDVNIAARLEGIAELGAVVSAWASALLDGRETGATELRQALAAYTDQGSKFAVPFYQGLLAEIEAQDDAGKSRVFRGRPQARQSAHAER